MEFIPISLPFLKDLTMRKDDPSSSDVHVDAVMGAGKKPKKKLPGKLTGDLPDHLPADGTKTVSNMSGGGGG